MAPPPFIQPTIPRPDCRSTCSVKSLHIPTPSRINWRRGSRSSFSTTDFVTLKGIRPLSLPNPPNPLRTSSPESDLVSLSATSQHRFRMTRINNVPSSGGFPSPCSPLLRRRLRPLRLPLPPPLRHPRQGPRLRPLSLSDLFPPRRRRRRPHQHPALPPPPIVRLPCHDYAGDGGTDTLGVPVAPSQVDSTVTREYDSLVERMVKARAMLGSAPPRSQFASSLVAVPSLAS